MFLIFFCISKYILLNVFWFLGGFLFLKEVTDIYASDADTPVGPVKMNDLELQTLTKR